MQNAKHLQELNQAIIQCQQCPRLNQWCSDVAQNKTKRFASEPYWGKPVPSFGDPDAKILVLGLAPAAHGANRTGRMFTGDQSGLWLYRALYNAGLSNQEHSNSKNNALKLNSVWISNVVHCAPPQNKPIIAERNQCLKYLHQELQLLKHLKCIICLGQYAFHSLYQMPKVLNCKMPFNLPKKQAFKHALHIQRKNINIICSYHPSQQNTFTGKLTQNMFNPIFNKAKKIAHDLYP